MSFATQTNLQQPRDALTVQMNQALDRGRALFQQADGAFKGAEQRVSMLQHVTSARAHAIEDSISLFRQTISEQHEIVDGLRSKSMTYGDCINDLKDHGKTVNAAACASLLKLESGTEREHVRGQRERQTRHGSGHTGFQTHGGGNFQWR